MAKLVEPGEPSETHALARGASWGLLGKVVGRVVHTATQVVLARTLGPGSYGLYAIGWTLLRLGALLTPLGLDRAMLKFGHPSPGRERGELKGVFMDALALGMLAATATAAVAIALPGEIATHGFRQPALAEVIAPFGVALFFACVLRLLVSATWSHHHVRVGVLAEDVGQPALNLLIVLASTWLGWGLRGATQAVLWSYAVAAAAGAVAAARMFPWVLDRDVRAHHTPGRLLRFSIPVGVATSLPVLLTWTDRLFVGALRPPVEMGVYQAASQLPVVFSLILSGVGGSILGPMIARLHTRQETARVRNLFVITTKWGLYASLPVFLTFILYAEDLIVILFGTEYSAGGSVLTILACAGLANAATGPVGLLLIMTGNERPWLLASILSLALDVLLQSQLTPRLGLTGAALATLGAVGSLFGAGVLIARRQGYWPYDGRYAKGAAAALAAAGAGLLVRALMHDHTAVAVAGVGALSICAAFVAVLVALGWDPEDYVLRRGFTNRFDLDIEHRSNG